MQDTDSHDLQYLSGCKSTDINRDGGLRAPPTESIRLNPKFTGPPLIRGRLKVLSLKISTITVNVLKSSKSKLVANPPKVSMCKSWSLLVTQSPTCQIAAL